MSASKRSVRAEIVAAAKSLSDEVDQLSFDEPVTHVYNPLRYAWKSHRKYLNRVNQASVRVVFVGMNPGPWGMAQTGVPFGEIAAVRDYLGIKAPVERPEHEHPKRPIEGFQCQRSEVSGRRLWGLFQERYEDADDFFSEHFVANYCPLVFMEESARNRTPDKLPAEERGPLAEACDRHLIRILECLGPEFVVAVGGYAEKCLQRVLADVSGNIQLTRILHPSPASPAANQGWSEKAAKQLVDAGVW